MGFWWSLKEIEVRVNVGRIIVGDSNGKMGTTPSKSPPGRRDGRRFGRHLVSCLGGQGLEQYWSSRPRRGSHHRGGDDAFRV